MKILVRKNFFILELLIQDLGGVLAFSELNCMLSSAIVMKQVRTSVFKSDLNNAKEYYECRERHKSTQASSMVYTAVHFDYIYSSLYQKYEIKSN